MTETVLVETEVLVEEKQVNPVVDAAHRTLQAGLGVVALTQDELESLFERLVERGEEAERDGRHRISELMERRREQAETRVSGAQGELETSIQRVLHRMNVPTKADIDSLNEKVTLLTLKVDALLRETA